MTGRIALLAALAFPVAGAFACAGAPAPDRDVSPVPSPVPSGPQLGSPFTLAPGETAALDAGKLRIRFVAVGEDSRCPKNEQCIWAGNARVDLEVTVGSGSPQTMSLNTNKGAAGAELGEYALALEGLAPAPISGRATGAQDYRVTLSVVRGAASRAKEDRPIR